MIEKIGAPRAAQRAAVFVFLFAISTSAQTAPLRDRIRVLRNITVAPGETANDILCLWCSVHVLGRVKGDIFTIGGSIDVEGEVDGDAVAAGGGIAARGQGKLAGDALAFGGYVERIGGGAIDGENAGFPYVLLPGQLSPTLLGSLCVAALNLLLAGLAYAILRAQRVKNMAAAIANRNGSVFGGGLIGLGMLYGLNRLCTYLGRAEATAEIVLLVVLLGVAAAGAAGLGYWVGKLAFPTTQGLFTTLAGILALTFLELVPLLGFVVAAVGWLMCLGAAIVTAFGARAVAPQTA